MQPIDTFHPRDSVTAVNQDEPQQGQTLALPPPPAVGAEPQAAMLGQAVQLDHLGPMVIGEGGSISRIANWANLTAREQQVALRRITARNRERLQRLRGGEAGGQEDTTAAAATATAAAGASARAEAAAAEQRSGQQ